MKKKVGVSKSVKVIRKVKAEGYLTRVKVVRDKEGRFARKTLPKRKQLAGVHKTISVVRDKQGHFAPKTLPVRKLLLPARKRPAEVKKFPTKKRPTKKLPAKKLPTKKLLAKKRPTKKLPAKKRPTKKLPAEKLPAKKPPGRKKPPVKPKKPPKRRYPTFMAAAMAAEALMQNKLVVIGELMQNVEPELTVGVKSFVNKDGTADAELRVGNLPDEWRTVDGLPFIVAAISEALRGAGALPVKPPMGGAFWISFALRFGPKDLAEIQEFAKNYKRWRGLLQLGAYHTTAQSLPAMLNNALALRMFISRLWERHNLPPLQLLIRLVWTPIKVNPGRLPGEEGEARR